LTYNMAEKQLA